MQSVESGLFEAGRDILPRDTWYSYDSIRIYTPVFVSVDIPEQFSRLHSQRPSNLADVGEADVLATPFNAPNVRSMESGQFRQCFLR